ncbi:uncharacterized protein LOC105700979 [Orussus abietinus]|uniref:uncharacterized protein LOC105700979 n=1 Tax=Orussus abietinus TaxID=222816 RepID=UPI000625B782|nr:uncharacterized protein LOC105700979 [Orussus abietinus]
MERSEHIRTEETGKGAKGMDQSKGRLASDERGLQEKRTAKTDRADEGEPEEEDDEIPTRRENVRYGIGAGLCAICHLTVSGTSPGGVSAGFEQTLSCSQGHLLCHRCIQRFAIRSDASCMLCVKDSQHSNSSCSRDSNGSLQRTTLSATRKYELQEQNVQQSVDEFRVNPWLRGYGTLEPTTSNKMGHQGHPMASETFCDWDTEQGDVRDLRRDQVSRQHQQRSYCSIIRKQDSELTSETKMNGQVATECSRRPIRCPRLDCAVNVAFSALTHHFLFDHPEVPILSVEPGLKSTLIVSFAALSCDSSRCLALLLVSGKLSGPAARLFNGGQIHPRYRNRLPLPVLAARLHCTSRYTTHDDVHAGGEGHGDGDVIVVWVAGLDIGNSSGSLRCSIEAVDSVENECFRSLTFTGPVNSLRTAQRPREVFLTGDCVILHEGLIDHITSGCTSLNVNITIH